MTENGESIANSCEMLNNSVCIFTVCSFTHFITYNFSYQMLSSLSIYSQLLGNRVGVVENTILLLFDIKCIKTRNSVGMARLAEPVQRVSGRAL